MKGAIQSTNMFSVCNVIECTPEQCWDIRPKLDLAVKDLFLC